MTFTIKCAWCGDTLVEGPRDAPISHGICRPCSKVVTAHAEASERMINTYRASRKQTSAEV